MTFGDVLYFVGFHVEYTAVRVGRGAAFWLRELAWALVRLLAVVLRPPVRAAADFRAALTHPHRLVGLLLPLAAGAALVFYVRTTLAQPFVLRVEVGGQTSAICPVSRPLRPPAPTCRLASAARRIGISSPSTPLSGVQACRR